MTKAKELSELASAATVTSGNVALSGGLDVDGVTDLDVVDIDGAVNMATTALVTGVLTTTAATVHTNGITMPDSAKAIFGAGSDLQIYHDSSNSYIQDTGTGNLHIRASSGIYLQGANAENGVTFFENGAVTLYHNNAAKLATTATGIDISGTAIVDRIQSANDSSDPWLKGTNSGGTETSYITKAGGAAFAGFIVAGATSQISTGQANIFQAGEGGNFFHIQRNEVQDVLEINTKTNTATTRTHFGFNNSNGTVGTIQTSGSGTAYNTSSDYRLKENVDYDWDATTRLKQLKPARFNFIADANKTVDGFLAHEAQAIVPEAVSGDKDAMMDQEYEVTPAVLDENGTETTAAVMGTRSVPDYQGIDQSKIVPLLVKTIQELEARITALEG